MLLKTSNILAAKHVFGHKMYLLQNTSLVIRYAISGKQSFNYPFLYHLRIIIDSESYKDYIPFFIKI